MQIAELQLATPHLAAQKAFYHNLCELPLVAESDKFILELYPSNRGDR